MGCEGSCGMARLLGEAVYAMWEKSASLKGRLYFER